MASTINKSHVSDASDVNRSQYSEDTPFTRSSKEPLIHDERSWFKRTFGPMEKGSVRSSIIALMSCAMGSGLLAFPSNAKNSGLLMAIILMTVCALISRLAMYLMMAVAFKQDVSTFPQMVEQALGSKVKKLFEVNIIIYMFGTCVCFQIIFCSFLWESVHSFGVSQDHQKLFTTIAAFSFIVLNLPISMLKDVYQLRYFAQLQLAVIFYIAFAIIVYFFAKVDFSTLSDGVEYFIFDLKFFSSFASTFYGFIAHQMILPLKSELQRCSMKRMNKVCSRSTTAIYIFYSFIQILGYLTWLEKTEDLIIDNYHDNKFFTVAQGLMAFALFFSVPININPLRLAILESIDKKDSKKVFVIVTVCIQLFSGILAYVYPDVKSAFGFLGGFLGLNMVVVVPCLIYVKTFPFNIKTKLIVLVCTLCTIFGWTGAIISQLPKD